MTKNGAGTPPIIGCTKSHSVKAEGNGAQRAERFGTQFLFSVDFEAPVVASPK
jgi:hypothetical protein